MRHEAREGFLLDTEQITRDILIPRYYDPRIPVRLAALSHTHYLRKISELIEQKELAHAQGNYIPKIYYGTGPFPYVRTSDLANLEIKASPKHGVPEAVYSAYAEKQDVRSADILFVHEGTYLIGSAAMVTPFDGPMLYQHHLDKFRVLPDASFGPFFFLVCLETSIVQSQIRARQFSADIIDSVVGRVEELVIPIPKDSKVLAKLEREVGELILRRAEVRECMSYVVRELELWLRGNRPGEIDDVFSWRPVPDDYQGRTAFLGGRTEFAAFTQDASSIAGDILIPKYYDPKIARLSKGFEKSCELVKIQELVEREVLEITTGDEIGRMNYGTGKIPFVRTSDLGNWELKRTPKQGVNAQVYKIWREKQDVQAGDVIVVRDGTYLVGTSIMVSEADLPMLYCGGILKLRSRQLEILPPALLLALLNLPFTHRQMRNKRFTRDVIDTLGHRLGEVVLPLPKDPAVRRAINRCVEGLLSDRLTARVRLAKLVMGLCSEESPH